MNMKNSENPASGSATLEQSENLGSGKFLTFFLAGEEYGLEILKVQEIMGIIDITPVPRTPDFVQGVVNLRGKIIPVIDLRLKFKMEQIEYTQETCIIVVQVENGDVDVTMGVIVDKVSEVMDIDGSSIEAAPEFGVQFDTEFMKGIGKVDEKVVIILDVDNVLTSHEIALAGRLVKDEK